MKINTVLILAGGKGTRLLPITKNKLPKSLVIINENKSILETNIEYFKKLGVNHIYISISYMKNMISRRIHDKGVTFIKEDELLGTGGSINNFIYKVKPINPFFVVPADSLIEFNGLKKLVGMNYTQKMTNNITCWHTTKSHTQIISATVKDNIIYNKKNSEMCEYLSSIPTLKASKIRKKYSKNNPSFETVTSIGLLVINPHKFTKYISTNNLTTPYCIYKDLAPLWIYGDQHNRMTIKVIKSATEIVDVGTPERLLTARRWLKYNHYKYRPLMVAHMGKFSINSTPNTLDSFIASAKNEVDGIEADLQFTKDQKVVINHHSYIDTSNDKSVLISEISHKTHSAAKNMLTLQQLLLSLKDNHLKVVLDIKSLDIKCFTKTLHLIKKYGHHNYFEIMSREPLLLKYVKDNSNTVQTGLLLDEEKFKPWMKNDFITDYLLKVVSLCNADYLHIPTTILKLTEVVQTLHQNNVLISSHHKTTRDLSLVKKNQINQITTEEYQEAYKFFN